MKRASRGWLLTTSSLALVMVGAGPAAPQAERAAQQAREEVARATADVPAAGAQVQSVHQLKTEAFQALRGGQFDRTSELLSQAARLSRDPALAQMASWSSQFETQEEKFTAERRKQYDKAAADVQTLLKNGKADYAIDAAAKTYLLAADKKAFRTEPWVDGLIKDTAALAEKDESSEQWLKALRLYSDLSAIEPANPEWKDLLKVVTRRVRLLALYTPDELKALQAAEAKSREEADAVLKASTQPSGATADAKATTTKPDLLGNDSFRIDWKESLRGIHMDMLKDALVDARTNYWREVTYRDLMIGGLKGLQAVATTKGLEKAFPNISDEVKRGSFLSTIDDDLTKANESNASNDQAVLRTVLANIQAVNGQTLDLPESVLVSEFADGAFAELDPFSSMIWPSDVEEFNKTTQGEFSGVGIQIQSGDDGSLQVVSPLEDSPAYKSGIKAGDVITQINGKTAKGITLNQAVKTITGPSNTFVTLTIRSPMGTVKDHVLRRETIKVASVKGWEHRPGGGWDYFVDQENKIGYIRLTAFSKTTGDELNKAVDEMSKKGAKAMIIDLRYNPGGLLTAATDVADKFLHDGVIVSTRADRETPNQPTVASAKGDDDEVPPSVPVVVLVNQYSASASEIVSGALKDQHRALIVGERTFGKGSVQMLFPLSSRSAYLKLTTSHYYLPSGKCIHREENSTEWGVDPDVTVEMTPEQMRAAIDARQEQDILRDAQESAPAEGEQAKLQQDAPAVEQAVNSATTQETVKHALGDKPTTKPVPKDLLSSDPQLSAGLLLLRLELAGAQI